jgi:hypothetical protein
VKVSRRNAVLCFLLPRTEVSREVATVGLKERWAQKQSGWEEMGGEAV